MCRKGTFNGLGEQPGFDTSGFLIRGLDRRQELAVLAYDHGNPQPATGDLCVDQLVAGIEDPRQSSAVFVVALDVELQPNLLPTGRTSSRWSVRLWAQAFGGLARVLGLRSVDVQ